MGKRLVSLLTALALAVSAFASLTVAPAGATVETMDNQIFFPFVPNGEEYGDMGPWYGVVTVQNPNPVAVTVQLQRANGTVITTADLQPFASKTFDSSQLFGDGNGGGVRVIGPSAQTVGTGAGIGGRIDLFRSAPVADTNGDGRVDPTDGGVDQIANPCQDFASIGTVTIRQEGTLFREWPLSALGDYTLLPGPGNTIFIVWWQENGGDTDFDPVGDGDTPGVSLPLAGTQYTVEITCGGPIVQSFGAPIAGVAKIVAPVASAAGRTSAQHEAVTGYTALPRADVDFAGQRNLVFPIVQTNNGWNSVLHITNFDAAGNCSVTVTLYQSPSGFSDPSYGQFIRLLARGETWHIDLAAQGVPAGWVGQAWVSSDCDVAATVDRVKAAQPWGDPVNMALTNQALPTPAGNLTQALPLVFQAYNGWNTGISIANLNPVFAANVTITYYNSAGVAVGTDSRVIQPRAMEFVYRPATTDVGIGGFGSALVTSSQPVLVAVDSVKYSGTDDDVGQALGYVAQDGTVTPHDQLFMPLFQKQGLLSGGNDNSGVALFNAAGLPARVGLELFDSSGAPVAPTLGGPVVADIPAHGQFIFYAPNYAEMPGGFQGSVVVTQWTGIGPVVGVSNNVNYDVRFDGSAAYNMPRSVAFDLLCDVDANPAAGDGTADCTISGFLGTGVVPGGVPILLEIDDGDGSVDDFTFDPAVALAGTPDPASDVLALNTNSDGSFVASAYWVTDGGVATQFSFDVNLYYDVDGNGALGPNDLLIGSVTCST
mgnify:CR=1 FL=1